MIWANRPWTPALAALAPRMVERMVSAQHPNATAVATFIQFVAGRDGERARECLSAVSSRLDALSERAATELSRELKPVLLQMLSGDKNSPVFLSAQLLAARLGQASVDPAAVRARFTATDQPEATRLQVLEALIAFRDPSLLEALPEVFASSTPHFVQRVLPVLGRIEDAKLADVLLGEYPKLPPELQPLAIDLLMQRERWARKFLDAVLANQLPKGALNANHLRKILESNDREALWAVEKAFGKIREERNPEREKVVAEMAAWLREHPGDPHRGQTVFRNLCAQCHTIYGEGGQVGPDITANGRASFEQLLSNVFDPSLVIGPAYQVTTVVTKDGRNLTGLITEDNEQRIVVRLPGEGEEPVARHNVKYTRVSKLSMMPEGIETFTDKAALADLFAFLALDKPPADPDAKFIPGAPGGPKPGFASKPPVQVPGGSLAATRQKTEMFHRDPQWDAQNNRRAPNLPPVVEQDFGYSKTHHAGKAAGEIGGRVSQSIQPAYYGKVIPAGTFDEPLTASGSLSVVEAQSISGWHAQGNIYVGWFNADERDLIWRPRNFIGFRLQSSNEPDGALVELTYGTREWQAGGMFVNAAGGGQQRKVRDLASGALLRIRPDGSKHQWTFRYDPTAANRAGEILFTFDGVETRLALPLEHRKVGASFNRFGMFPPRIPGRHIVAYLDDLTLNDRLEDFADDPQWEGLGNRLRHPDPTPYGHNDFGFSPSSHAGGSAGEIGGRFFSCNPDEDEFKAYHGDRIGELTLQHRLSARGKFMAKEFCIDSSLALGWFNSKKQGWPLENFVGVYFDSLSSVGRIVAPLYGTARGSKRHGSEFVKFEPGRAYEWTLDYDPAAAEGRGAITFGLSGKSVTLPLQDGDKTIGALLNRFGVFNLQWANSKWCDVYFDDLSYTVSTDSR